MQSGDDELKEIFLAEAMEQTAELNKLFTVLEKNHSNKKTVGAIFRITHTLKANAAGMGFDDIAGIAHVMEDVFNEIKNDNVALNLDLFNDLFKANDILCALIERVKTPGSPVKFRGIKTKLEVFVKNLKSTEADKATEGENNKVSTLSEEIKEIVAAVVPTEIAPELNSDSPTEVEAEEEEKKITISENISIPVRKLDNLLNLVGELIIEKDRVIALNAANSKGRNNEYARLQRITSELQYSIMNVRLVQVNVLFQKFHRIVRDVATLENKKVDLILEGTENEIDRNILQIISDSLVHLVRNSVSHGIEKEDDRLKKGKPATGTITLRAKSEKDEVVIEIKDDGQGIDPKKIAKKAIEKGLVTKEMVALMSEEDLIQIIFEPGFSSAEQITEVSGRGVGMDVVKRAIDSIGGMVTVTSEIGLGTSITLRLPSSMAVKGALLFDLSTGVFAAPLSYIKAVISIPKGQIFQMGNNLFTTYLSKNISLVYLNDLFSLNELSEYVKNGTMLRSFQKTAMEEKVNIIIISFNNKEIGFVVDKLLLQKEIVEKPLQEPLSNVKFISGATIMGNGDICLVLDVPSIFNYLFKGNKVAREKSLVN